MANYSFSTLSPTEFENLCRDLITESHGVRFSTFKAGRDGGVDFRYTTPTGNDWIGQAKHYAATSVAKLKLDLLKEAPKVAKLKPEVYIIATSCGLTPNDHKDIASIFQSDVAKPVEVLGREDLNQLIDSVGREVERRHYKLWLTSVNVMEKILHSKIITLTEYTLDAMRRKLSRYVQNESYAEALRILNEHGVVIISGDPGIGKTTLAQVLLAHYVDEGYTPVKVTTTIGEAAQVDSAGGKIAFYYDDFLGRYSLNSLLEKNEDQTILEFIDRTQKTSGRRLIMTTREYILKDASLRYERLAHSTLASRKYILDVGKYTIRDKANILFNHLYFSSLPQEYIETLIESGNLPQIVRHRNYNPRVIEAMTSGGILQGMSASAYPDRFLANLDNPTQVYEHVFENQLSDAEQSVLYVLFSLAPECELELLEQAYASFVSDRAGEGVTIQTHNEFERALRRLDDTLTSTRKLNQRIYVSFHNPSVEEFVSNRVRATPVVARELLRKCRFLDQCWFSKKGDSITGNPSYIFEDAETVAKAIVRTLGTELGPLRQNADPTGEVYSLFRWRPSQTDQMIRALQHIDGFHNEKVTSYAVGIVQMLAAAVENQACSPGDGVAALFAVEESIHKEATDVERLVRLTAEFLSSQAEEFHDWEGVRDFLSRHPDALTSDESSLLSQHLKEYGEGLEGVSFHPETPERWEEEAHLLSSVGELLEADVEQWINFCGERAEKVRLEQPQYEDDDERWREYGNRNNSWMTDTELIAMFNPLRDGFRGATE